MSALKDLTGKKFERLLVIRRDIEGEKNYKTKGARWICKCECGNEKSISSSKLLSGNIKSCGCLNKEKISIRSKKYNQYDLSNEFGIGYTYDGRKFYFDLDDFEKIKEYRWYFNNNDYLTAYDSNSKQKILLHRLIIDAKDDEIVDHIFGDKFDNRRMKLRIVTKSQNQQNQKRSNNNKFGRTGIVYSNSWGYTIQSCGKKESRYGFETFEDAVRAREEAEERLHGEFKSYEYRTEES